jgi:dihydroorotase
MDNREGMRFCFVFLTLAVATFAQQQHDLLLKGGRLIDPKNNIDARMDVAVRDGKVSAVAPNIDASTARQTLDVSGLVVTPGLIDLHVHVYHSPNVKDAWAGANSVQPDAFSFRTGTTTMVDAGSAGWRNFEDFRFSVIDRVNTRVLALINISGFGMMTDFVEQGDFDAAAVAALAKKHKDIVVGVKSAHYQKPDWESVDQAIAAGKAAGVPIMVDFGYFLPERPYWQLVTERLRPGDISTHMFRGPVPYADKDGKLYEYLKRARSRGVRFDVGHGGGSFAIRNAVPAIQQGFYPDSISTDLHNGSMNGGMMDMPTTMSKLLVMGMPLKEVIRASTWTPAQMIRREELGHLSVGAIADIAAFNVMKGKFGYVDAYGARIEGQERILCELAVSGGRVVWNWNGRGGKDYKKLAPDYGVRPGLDAVVPPPK